jgi:GNAT superfamily N-acetyltransferase
MDQDARAVLAIWNDAFVFSDTVGQRAPIAREDYHVVLSAGDWLVAERQGAVCGTIALLAPGSSGSIALEGELEIVRLAVARGARRQGVARTLLAWAHGEARRRGACALVLVCLADQLEAQRLSRDVGYRHLFHRDPPGSQPKRLVLWLPLRRNGGTYAAMRSRD